MKKSTALSIVLLLIANVAFSQLVKDVFPLTREFRRGGFYVSPLLTYSFGNKVEGNFNNSTINYNYKTESVGKLGYGLELGWFHTFKGFQVGDWFEGALSYRKFGGKADHEGKYQLLNQSVFSENEFSAQNITAAIRVIDVINLKPGSFFTWGVGVNYNYLFASDYKREIETYPTEFETFQETSTVQAHLQFGYGFRVSDKLLLMPTIETPIITAYPTDELNPAFTFFGVKYHPIIVGIRFMFLRNDPVNCNSPSLMPAPGS